MFWVVQENIRQEEHHDTLVNTLKRYGLPHALVKVIPFVAKLEPDINPENPVIVIGSVSLADKVASRKGWKPGSFKNENFDFQIWSEAWKGHILNDEAVVSPFNEVRAPSGLFFIRPCADNKAFAGAVMSTDEYQSWYYRLSQEEVASDLNFELTEMVVVAPLKNILREMRFFVVGGEIVTHSTYKLGDKVQYFDSSMTDRKAIEFVEERIKEWQPAEAFVVDVAYTDQGYKVIEINNINSAGFYKADVVRLVEALENWNVT